MNICETENFCLMFFNMFFLFQLIRAHCKHKQQQALRERLDQLDNTRCLASGYDKMLKKLALKMKIIAVYELMCAVATQWQFYVFSLVFKLHLK